VWRATNHLLDAGPRASCRRCRGAVLVRLDRGGGAELLDVRIGADGERLCRPHVCREHPDARPLLEGYLP